MLKYFGMAACEKCIATEFKRILYGRDIVDDFNYNIIAAFMTSHAKLIPLNRHGLKLLKDNLDATISSRATNAGVVTELNTSNVDVAGSCVQFTLKSNITPLKAINYIIKMLF
jgi:hypothetical protein